MERLSTPMPPTTTQLRVLIVDDNRDGADALGLLVEAFGNQVHVTYGGTQALDVASAFRPQLMLIDLAMPDMNGCALAQRFRQIPAFAQTSMLAITGHTDLGHQTLALKAGFDAVLAKPVALQEIEGALNGVREKLSLGLPEPRKKATGLDSSSRMLISEARRIRNERKTKTLTVAESEAAVCEGMTSFREEYLGWITTQIQAHFIKDLLVIRIAGVLTLAERQLSQAAPTDKGRDLVKLVRKQLLELARPMLESLVHEITGVKVKSLHHDISTTTGEEFVVFSLASAPKFE